MIKTTLKEWLEEHPLPRPRILRVPYTKGFCVVCLYYYEPRSYWEPGLTCFCGHEVEHPKDVDWKTWWKYFPTRFNWWWRSWFQNPIYKLWFGYIWPNEFKGEWKDSPWFGVW